MPGDYKMEIFKSVMCPCVILVKTTRKDVPWYEHFAVTLDNLEDMLNELHERFNGELFPFANNLDGTNVLVNYFQSTNRFEVVIL